MHGYQHHNPSHWQSHPDSPCSLKVPFSFTHSIGHTKRNQRTNLLLDLLVLCGNEGSDFKECLFCGRCSWARLAVRGGEAQAHFSSGLGSPLSALSPDRDSPLREVAPQEPEPGRRAAPCTVWREEAAALGYEWKLSPASCG